VSIDADAHIVLRPRGVVESADLGVRLAMAHVGPVARLSAIVLPLGLLATLGAERRYGLTAAQTWCVAIVLATAAEAPYTLVAGAVALRGPMRVRDALRDRYGSVIACALLRWFVLGIHCLAIATIFIPYMFTLSALLFVPEVVMLERNARNALQRSSRIVQTMTGRALATAVLLLCVRAGCVILGEVGLRSLVEIVLETRGTSRSLWSDGVSPYALAGFWLAVPAIAVLRYAAYIDLRTLREGWDVQRRFQRMAARLTADQE